MSIPVFEEILYLSAHVLMIELRLFRHEEFSIDDFVALPSSGSVSRSADVQRWVEVIVYSELQSV